jgi:hypothetical protein
MSWLVTETSFHLNTLNSRSPIVQRIIKQNGQSSGLNSRWNGSGWSKFETPLFNLSRLIGREFLLEWDKGSVFRQFKWPFRQEYSLDKQLEANYLPLACKHVKTVREECYSLQRHFVLVLAGLCRRTSRLLHLFAHLIKSVPVTGIVQKKIITNL